MRMFSFLLLMNIVCYRYAIIDFKMGVRIGLGMKNKYILCATKIIQPKSKFRIIWGKQENRLIKLISFFHKRFV